jgi:hypothetical protein
MRENSHLLKEFWAPLTVSVFEYMDSLQINTLIF